MTGTAGIHHVTAISADLDRNLDFYTRVLGLRLVKRTVNFDDPSTWHLYYGDGGGRPGTILTFFIWPGGNRGRLGTGVASAVAFAVPPAAMGYWYERLISQGLRIDPPSKRLGESVLEFADPEGMRLEIVGSLGSAAIEGWAGGPVAGEHAIRGLHSVTIWEDGDQGHEATLTGLLGLARKGEEDNRIRFAGTAPIGAVVDIRRVGGFWHGLGGAGVVHHVAFRVPDDAAEAAIRERAAQAGLHPTAQLDRYYFRSVYFRQPRGVLFEVATDGPGFTADEPVESLGSALRLPPWMETSHTAIEARLPGARAWPEGRA
jgi:glyoxalase family protein